MKKHYLITNLVFYTIRALTLLLLVSSSLASNAQLNCSVNAGVPATFCQGETMPLLGGTSGLPIAGTERWRQLSGPTTTIADTTAKTTSALAVSPGTYVFRFSSDCNLGSNFQDVTYTVDSVAGGINAGAAQTTACYTGGPILLSSTGRTPTGSLFTDRWQVTSGPSGTFSKTGSDWYFTPNYGSTSSFNCGGDCGTTSQLYTFAYSLTNSANTTCVATTTTATDKELTITDGDVPFLPGPANDVCVTTPGCDNPTAPYQAWGKCEGSGTGQWTITPSAGITLSSATDRYITIDGVVPGQSYKLVWDVTGRTCGIDGKDSITFSGSYASAVSTASASSAVTDFCTNIPTTLTLTGNNVGVGENGVWTQIDGDPVTINSPTASTTTATGFTATGGPYTFQYTISNVACSSSDIVTITVNDQAPDFLINDVETCVPFNSSTSTNFSQGVLPADAVSPFNYTSSGTYGVGRIISPSVTLEIISHPEGAKLSTSFPSYYLQYNNAAARVLTYAFNQSNVFGRATPGPYVTQVTATNSCGSKTGTFTQLVGLRGNTAINAGTDQILPCGNTTTELAGNAVELPSWEYLGSIPSGAPTPTFTTTQDTAFPGISGLVGGYTYNYRYTSGRGTFCERVGDDMQVVASSLPPPAASIYTTANQCGGADIKLEGELPTGLTGQWNLLSANPGASIESPTMSSTYLLGTDTSQTYQVEWVVSNGCGSTRDTLDIVTNSNFGPARALAGEDICHTSTNRWVQLNASPIDGNTIGTWNLIGAPSTSLTNANNRFRSTQSTSGTANVDTNRIDPFLYVYFYGGYRVTWTTVDTAGLCPASIDTLDIGARMGTFNLDDNISICNTTLPVSIDLNSNPANSSAFFNSLETDGPVYDATWQQVGGDLSAATIANTAADSTTASITSYGTYTFERTGRFSGCERSEPIHVFIPEPASIPSARDTSICGTSSGIQMLADSLISGIGFWSVDSGAGGSFEPLSESQKHNGNFEPNPGVTRLKWNSSPGGPCTEDPSFDYAYISYNETADAGTDENLCEANAISLFGSNPQPGYGIWTKVSGPGTQALLPSDTLRDPLPVAVDGLQAGVYLFEYAVTSPGCPPGLDTISITIDSLPIDPNAGINDTTCMPNGGSVPITLMGNTPPTGYSATWTKELGTGSAYTTTGSTGSYTATDSGSYVFSYEFSNGVCTIKDYVDYIFKDGSPDNPISLTGLRVCNDSFLVEVAPALVQGKFTYSWEFDNATPSAVSGLDLDSIGIVKFNTIGNHETRLLVTGPYPECNTSDTVLTSVICTVPVELISLQAVKSGNQNALVSWSTASEKNSDKFEVYRKTPRDQDFTYVGEVKAAGHSFVVRHYSLLDDISNVNSGTIYYRLKMIDWDGTSEFSEIVSVEQNSENKISAYPVPVRTVLSIDMEYSGRKNTTYEIIDLNGTAILQGTITESHQEIDVAILPAGAYYLKVQEEYQLYYKPIIKTN